MAVQLKTKISAKWRTTNRASCEHDWLAEDVDLGRPVALKVDKTCIRRGKKNMGCHRQQQEKQMVKYIYIKFVSPAAVADEAAVGVHPLLAVAHHTLVQEQGWTYWS
jgi:hypothetical protein